MTVTYTDRQTMVVAGTYVVFQLKNDVIQFMVVPTSENSDNIWVRYSDKLHILSVNWEKSIDVVKWKDVCISYINYRRIDLLSGIMSYDGISNVFLAVRNENLILLYAVNGEYLGLLPLVYTVNGEYLGLLPLLGFEASLTSFAVDRQHNLLFVGCKEARVRVFQFLY